jgi:transitional endoplasmic reticulum ATPase
MTDDKRGFRPRNEVFHHAGARFELVDPVGVLAAAVAEPVRLLAGAKFPAPIQELSVTVSCTREDDELRHVLTGEIRTDDGGFPRRVLAELGDRSGLNAATTGLVTAVALTSPVGALAVGIVAHRLGLLSEPASAKRTDRSAGPAVADRPTAPRALPPAGSADPDLRVAITRMPPAGDPSVTGDPSPAGERRGVVSLRAVVPSDLMHPAHLRAFLRRTLHVAQEQAGRGDDPEFLAGRTYVVVRSLNRRQPPSTASTAAAAAAATAAATARSALASVTRNNVGPGPMLNPAAESATVTLDDVGGLVEIVAQLREVAISFQHQSVMARWGARRPQGILMYGPPGTGKTMLAKALAHEIGATLREIRTPEILDKWLGGSERNIKNIFTEARRHQGPLVLLFDEFDSIISYTIGSFDAANHAVNAVAGIFKQEMNTLVEENPNVIVVATTNFPDRVDDSLIRSGRFDLKMAVPPPDVAARTDIFVKVLRGLATRYERGGFRMFGDDVDATELAELTPEMTGADIKELLRRIQLAKAMEEARGTGPADPISQHDLARAIADMRRSGT